jgi:hypothetical protein
VSAVLADETAKSILVSLDAERVQQRAVRDPVEV